TLVILGGTSYYAPSNPSATPTWPGHLSLIRSLCVVYTRARGGVPIGDDPDGTAGRVRLAGDRFAVRIRPPTPGPDLVRLGFTRSVRVESSGCSTMSLILRYRVVRAPRRSRAWCTRDRTGGRVRARTPCPGAASSGSP